jgi:hypothetical protein
MKTIKLNSFEQGNAKITEMNKVIAGNAESSNDEQWSCRCSCYYANLGGSDTDANGKANYWEHKNSVHYSINDAYYISDGKGGCINFDDYK